jgi:uncharacterized protein (TIGR03663 family)
MHTDEAVHGIKFGELLETGFYKYDKSDYHGPTLNYFTFIPALIRSQKTLVELDEFTLRSVPALFGLAFMLLLLLITKTFGWREILTLALLIAIAPMLVFYSRYYIQEVLLVFFNTGFILSACKYFLERKVKWIIIAGLFAGLMMATKETWVIFFGVQALSLFLVLSKRDKPLAAFKQIASFFKTAQFLIFAGTVMLVYIIFYSSFFTNWQGVAESFKAFTGYLERAGGQDLHHHPWWYYLEVLTKSFCNSFLLKADLWFVIGGITGFLFLLKSKQKDERHLFYLFFGYSTIISGLILSVLTYKTPWNFLMVYTGLIILTNYAVTQLLKSQSKRVYYVLFTLAIIHIGYQIYTDNFVSYAEPCNTFVYSHPTNEIFDIISEVYKICDKLPDEMPRNIEVIVAGHEYWPLPWYFRDLKNVSYYANVDIIAPAAPFIISSLPNPELSKKLFEMPAPGQRFLYIPMFETDKALRTGVTVNILLRKDYWDVYKKNSPVN